MCLRFLPNRGKAKSPILQTTFLKSVVQKPDKIVLRILKIVFKKCLLFSTVVPPIYWFFLRLLDSCLPENEIYFHNIFMLQFFMHDQLS